jgi:WXG100 family type VII secretion target
MSGQIQTLDTSGFVATEKFISEKITSFDDQVKQMRITTNDLLSTWQGKGRNEFETQVNLMMSRLGDISDELYDLYNALVSAEKEYIDADQAAAKAISISGN